MQKGKAKWMKMSTKMPAAMRRFFVETEAVGIALYYLIRMHIARQEGYYVKDTNEFRIELKDLSSIDFVSIDWAIRMMLKHKIFSKELYDRFNILTSLDIQKDYFQTVRNRKEIPVNLLYIVDEKYLTKNALKYMPGDIENIAEETTEEKYTTTGEEKEMFREAHKVYPGDKSDIETEFKNFVFKHKDHKRVAPMLLQAVKDMIRHYDMLKENGLFCPEYKPFRTWINGRYWEVEFADMQKRISVYNKKGDEYVFKNKGKEN